jgi:membrane protein
MESSVAGGGTLTTRRDLSGPAPGRPSSRLPGWSPGRLLGRLVPRRPRPVTGRPVRRVRLARRVWPLVRRTAAQAWADRVLGLSAEAAFWALLSLTPLLLVLVAAIGYLTPLFGPNVAAAVEARILGAAEQVLALSAVDGVA